MLALDVYKRQVMRDSSVAGEDGSAGSDAGAVKGTVDVYKRQGSMCVPQLVGCKARHVFITLRHPVHFRLEPAAPGVRAHQPAIRARNQIWTVWILSLIHISGLIYTALPKRRPVPDNPPGYH